jgi:hypothetical protein
VGYGYPRRLVGPGSVFTIHGMRAMFKPRPEWLPDYEYATAAVRASGAKRVGLAQHTDTWEYPLWVLMPGTELVSLQSLLPKHPPVNPASTDAVICIYFSAAECQSKFVPAGWTVYQHGVISYGLPPGK